MKKLLPILLSLFMVGGTFLYVSYLKESTIKTNQNNIGNFNKSSSCHRFPNFLNKLHIPQPIAIDLSQKHYKGLAFLYGRGFSQAVHLKTWEKFDYFSTYALDSKGNTFLTPMPFVSVNKNSFEFQKNIYKLDTNSGKLSIWLTLEEVNAGAYNPFGVISLVYDCDDNSLWVSTIDESSYEVNRGEIYHIDRATKKILQRIKGVDALSLALVKSEQGKFLLMGEAKKSELLAMKIEKGVAKGEPFKLFDLPSANEHVRKIKIRGENLLELQTIPFSYSLIAQTTEGDDRRRYHLQWSHKAWSLSKL
jgi:hypothetical protein